MRFPKTARILLLALIGLTLAPLVAGAQGKVGVVDIARALKETEDGRKAQAKLKKLFDAKQKSLDKKKNELVAMKESVEKQASVLSREVLAQKSQELQKAFSSLQNTYMGFQQELAKKEQELTKDILARMQQIVRRIGQKEGYSVILDKNEAGVVFVPTTNDLTDLLIQRYNGGSKKGKKGKK